MSALFLYSLVLSVTLTLLWCAYRMSGITACGRLRLCRTILLGIVVTGLIISFLPFAPRSGSPASGTVTESPAITFTGVQPDYEPSAVSVMVWLTRIYFIGLIISLAGTLLTLARILRLVAGSHPYGPIRIHRHYGLGPFAWGRWIILSSADYHGHSDEDNAMLIAHESAHLRGAHWIDLLIINLVICLTWYWPIVRLLRRDMMTVHEFIADRSVIETGFPAAGYQMMLISKVSGRRFAASAADSINNVSLKTRIIMMRQSTPRRFAVLRGLVLLPAVVLAATLASSSSLAAFASSRPAVELLSSADKDNTEKQIFTAVEQPATFPGGDPELMMWLAKNIRYPADAVRDSIQGRVVVQFVVGSDGSVSDPRIVRGVSPSIDKEAIRVISALPKFNPGKMSGKPVNSWYTLPIIFRLQSK